MQTTQETWGPSQWMRRKLFCLNPSEATFERRRFVHQNPAATERLERVGTSFLFGYNAAVEMSYPSELPDVLNTIDQAHRGFAYEGAGMGLAMLDEIFRWKANRADLYLAGPGKLHAYMVHVGIGLAWAQLKLKPYVRLQRMDPILRWLAMDGYGFHAGYFHWEKSLVEQKRPTWLTGYAARAFDQGLGRSLWFVKGGGIQDVAVTIAAFPSERRSDLWAGIGLATAYAGSGSEEELGKLLILGRGHAEELMQGATFAAAARFMAGNPVAHTDMACRVYGGMSLEEAAQLFERCRPQMGNLENNVEPYELWRRGVQNCFQRH